MSAAKRQKALPLGLAVASFALAIAQAPGRESFDTKVNLHVAPARFLSSVLAAWSPTGDLGHVQSDQYVGYLFPMGPFFAVGRLLGIPDWLVDRLWLGTVLALAAWGMVRLLDALLDRSRGVEHLIAGLAYIANPYVVTFADRTSVSLATYAALPWLLLAVHRGIRTPRHWWWPALFALIAASSGGGVNAATLAWVLVGPALLLGYEIWFAGVGWRPASGFAWRAILASFGASLWWVGGVLVGGLYGLNFLPFIEQPGTIWGSTSLAEALRGMGYWISYTGVGFAGKAVPVLTNSSALLFSWPVVLASVLVPGLSLAGFAWTRRWRYGPFFLALVLVGAAIVVAGFPDGTPLRSGLYFLYNRVPLVRFLRTSYKASPLIMLGIAVLLGVACGEALRRAPSLRPRRIASAGLIAGSVVLIAVAAWPLTTGNAVGVLSSGVPAAWRVAAHQLDRQLPANSRALVLPGQLFSFYRWGSPVDPILPALSSRPVAQRSITPSADLHATDLLWTIDGLVEQQRLYPGELRPLLSLIGARAVIVGTDDDRLRSGSVDPSVAAHELAGQGLTRPARAYGPVRALPTPAEQIYPTMKLPEVRRYDLAADRGLVSVEPASDPLVIDGSAEGLAGLAAFGALPVDRAIFYAGDTSVSSLRDLASQGAQVVITDSNRRRVFVNSRVDQDEGQTIGANDSFSADAAVLDPFASRGGSAQTVQVLTGVRYIRAPYSPGFSQFPEHRPYAAFDGSRSTAWLADPSLDPSRRWIEVGFVAPRDVPYVDLMPADDSRGTVLAVEIAGRRFAVKPGWNHIVLGLRKVHSLRIRIASVRSPPDLAAAAGGLSEVRVPGLRVTESLRVPVTAERALAGTDLNRVGLTYLFERTTGDDPLERMRGHGPWQAYSTRDAGDAETGLRRLFAPPAIRTWTSDARVSLSPFASDSELDRLVGFRGQVVTNSSGRFLNQGRFRASSAFDGLGTTAWVGELEPGWQPWISWTVPHDVSVRRLRLVTPPSPVRVPSKVALSVDRRAQALLTVGPGGVLSLPAAERGRVFRLTILATRLPRGVPQQRRAVGIGEIEGAGVPRLDIPRTGRLRTRCGIASFDVGGHRVPLGVDGSIRTLDTGGALRARQCSTAVPLAAGVQLLRAGSGVFRIDWLRLRSPAPDVGVMPPGGGRILSSGHFGRTSVTGVRVALAGPSWLVLGESYDRGWRARCNGRSLGSPTVINGYANGWRVSSSCRAVSFAFAPQGLVVKLFVVSGAAVLVLLLILLLTRRPKVVDEDEPNTCIAARQGALNVQGRRAVLAGVGSGVVLGFIFGGTAGILIAMTVALILWRGLRPRVLSVAGGLLLAVVVPAIYLTQPVRNLGGYNTRYALRLVNAHWVAVAAFVLFLVALARALADARGDPG